MFLKYLSSLSALLLTVTLPIHAQQRSYDEAVKVATNFFQSQNNTSTVSALQQKATHARKLIKYSKKQFQPLLPIIYFKTKVPSN